MHDAHGATGGLEAGGDLKETPRIAGDDDLRVGFEDVLDLPIAQLCCGLRLDQVVDARGPAADLRFGDLPHGNSRYRLQQLSRLCAHSLRMLKMTCVVICRFEL